MTSLFEIPFPLHTAFAAVLPKAHNMLMMSPASFPLFYLQHHMPDALKPASLLRLFPPKSPISPRESSLREALCMGQKTSSLKRLGKIEIF